jgi:DNA repair ATPase RecN
VSSAVKDFTDQERSTSLVDATEKYNVVETANDLRNIGVFLRKNGIPLEEASSLLLSLERIEKQTGKTPDAILKHVSEAEKRRGELDSEIKGLEAEKANLQTQKLATDQACKEERTRHEAELQSQLSQHKLTMELVARVPKVTEALAGYGIDLEALEELQNILFSIKASGQDPSELVELAKKAENLSSQVENANKKLTELEESIARKERQITLLKKRQNRALSLARKSRHLERMGWTAETLEKVAKLTVSTGSPEDVFERIELTKTKEDLKIEVDGAKLELEKLRQGNLAEMKKALDQLQELTANSSIFVHTTLPSVVSQINGMMTEKVKLISKYDTLAQECRELQDKQAKLKESCSQYQNKLDEAIGWTKFLTDPANVVPGNMNMIYFDIMIPKLLAWGKNKDYETKRNIATETFKKVFILLGEKTQIFFENPGKADYPGALYAIRCFAVITAPFLNSLSSWNKGHPQSAFAFQTNRPFRDLQYYFEEINKTLRII